ncbi:MAG: DUF3105 domain-containing protein [Actinomycetota bacterium]
MSQKPTKKDRREATKQARIEAERRAAKQRRKRWAYGGLGAALVVALIVGLVLASGGSSAPNVAQLNTLASAAGCSPVQVVADQGRGHVNPPQTVTYNSNPPTSGTHWGGPAGVAPAPTGVHTSPIADEAQVHNLEHGHIGIQYSTALDAAVRDALESFTRSHDTYVFMAPRPQLDQGTSLAITRWDNKITCASPTNADAVVALVQKFYDDYHGDGPEGAIPGTPLQ